MWFNGGKVNFSGAVSCVISSVIASDERSNPARRNFEGAVERLRLNTWHQLGCFALVAQNDSQDRFVADGERSAPRNDGDVVRHALSARLTMRDIVSTSS